MVGGDGQVRLNRNVVNGTEPILRLIGRHLGRHTSGVRGRPQVGWLVQLLKVIGSAGTGKTWLALEHARLLAAAGERAARAGVIPARRATAPAGQNDSR